MRTCTTGMRTPWGAARRAALLAAGVCEVKTGSHGGILVAADQADRLLSARARQIGQPWRAYVAFEEDTGAAVVFYEHPEYYGDPADPVDDVRAWAEAWIRERNPQYFA